jgi:hypothetical protein
MDDGLARHLAAQNLRGRWAKGGEPAALNPCQSSGQSPGDRGVFAKGRTAASGILATAHVPWLQLCCGTALRAAPRVERVASRASEGPVMATEAVALR